MVNGEDWKVIGGKYEGMSTKKYGPKYRNPDNIMYAVPKIPEIKNIRENFRTIAICSKCKLSPAATWLSSTNMKYIPAD